MKFYYKIITIVVASFMIILCVQLLKQTPKKNGFNRLIKRHKNESAITVLDLKSDYMYFAGLSNSKIYLKSIGDGKGLFSLSYSLNDLEKLDLKMRNDTIFQNKKINIGVKGDGIYLTSRSGDLSIISRNNKQNFRNPGIRFDQSFMISNQTLAVRQTILKGTQLRRNLTVYNYLNNTIGKSHLLEKQIDGYFCTDGLLYFDSVNSLIFYIFFYRGQYLCLDTNLNLLYSNKTIDTISTAKMEVVESRKRGIVVTQKTPPRLINRNLTTYKERLFILSALKSDNESRSDFRNNQIVDVYDIKNGKYLYSSYIPKYKGKKIREIRIANGSLLVIYDEFLIKYKLEETGLL